ncbi:hypothetical protein Q1695_006670 [Nippostrongylus brasiliensis]|nr:hypothetical protein Q1695_006670 [Nippostrongylus brasiliensis]
MPVGNFATAFLLAGVAAICGATVDWASISTPPRFIHEPNGPILYFKVEKHGTEQSNTPDNLFQITINCKADGNPAPSYRWTKDRTPFSVEMYPEKVIQKPGEGTLVFTKLDETDAGTYQCQASNDNGTAISLPTRLEQTWIHHFPIIEPEVVRVELGDPYSRNCTPPISNPSARVYWILKGDEGTAVTFESINSSHISSNEQAGCIYFPVLSENEATLPACVGCLGINAECASRVLLCCRLPLSLINHLSTSPSTHLHCLPARTSDPLQRTGDNYICNMIFIFKLAVLFAIGTLPNRYYTCTAENTELKDYKFGSQFSLEITTNRRRSLGNVPPSEQYVNQSSPIALQGQQHKLHCFFSGYPAPKPTWYHNGREISEDTDEGFRFESYGKTLVFNVTQDKAGKYDCRFPVHNDIDRSFNVIVEAAPYWPDGPPPNTNTSEGETVTFDCTTSGKPVPKVTFYKNGVEMKKPKDGDKWVIETNRLTIYEVKKGIHGKGDNAVYQCKAENKHGYVWTNFYLNLLAFKPQLLTDAGEVEAVVGQSVTLECKFFASPNAVITWASPVLQGIAHNVIPANPHGVGKLVISSVTPEAEGEYECTGTNKYGQAKGAAKLLVRKATRLEPFQRAEEVKIAGETIRLPCEATPDDRLEVKYEWHVNGQPLSEVHLQSGHYKVDSDNALLVHNPTQYDSARYKCIASTKLDKVEKEVQIQIKDVPVPAHAAYVSKCDSDSQSAEITFEHMEPASTVSPVKEFWVQYQMDSETEGTQWRTHPVPVQAHPNDRIEGDQRIVNGKVTVPLQPFGHYVFRVLARNGVGDSAPTRVKDVCITPPKQPDRNPSGVWAKGASPENIVVHWRPMAREEWNGKNFHYKIKYRPSEDGDGEWKEVQVNDPFADRFTITLDDDKDVKPFVPYEVQVQAVNDEGQANVAPETVQGYSGEGVPSSIPTGFRVISKDGTTATFAWDPVDPRTANGNFTGYKITYWYDETDGEDDNDVDAREARLRFRRSIKKRNTESKRRTVVFGPKATSGTITDLQPDTMNYATIQVTNGAHEGEPSEVIQFRTAEGVPSPVRGLRAYPMNPKSDDEQAVVHLMWKRPRRPNGKLLNYVVERCRTQNGRVVEKDCPTQDVPADRTQARLTNLEFGTPYRFIVRARTSAGEGDPNSSDASTLPKEVPIGVLMEEQSEAKRFCQSRIDDDLKRFYEFLEMIKKHPCNLKLVMLK